MCTWLSIRTVSLLGAVAVMYFLGYTFNDGELAHPVEHAPAGRLEMLLSIKVGHCGQGRNKPFGNLAFKPPDRRMACPRGFKSALQGVSERRYDPYAGHDNAPHHAGGAGLGCAASGVAPPRAAISPSM